MSVAEKRKLRWTNGMNREDKIKNEYIRVEVASIIEKKRKKFRQLKYNIIYYYYYIIAQNNKHSK